MAEKDDTKEIDWNDEEAVRKLRGDVVDEADPDETPEKEEDDDGVQEDEAKKPDAEAEAEVEDEGGEEGGKKKEPMIPKSRYDSKAAENRELKERLERIEREKAAKVKESKQQEETSSLETEIDALEDLYMEAISKDETDKAKELRKQIRAKERQMFQTEISAESDKTSDRTREQVRLDLTIDHIEQTHKQFNPDSDEYDAELVSKVQELRAGFEHTGNYTPTQALLKAIDIYMPKGAVKEVEKAGSDRKVDEERRKAGLKKATDAANKQPVDADKVGEDADSAGKKGELNVDKLTYDDVANLPESTLRRMRGDFVA
jgi:hypothetical protein